MNHECFSHRLIIVIKIKWAGQPGSLSNRRADILFVPLHTEWFWDPHNLLLIDNYIEAVGAWSYQIKFIVEIKNVGNISPQHNIPSLHGTWIQW